VAHNVPDRRHREGTNDHRPPPAGGDRLGRWNALVSGRLDRRAVHAVIRRIPLHVGRLGDLAGSRRFRESVQRCPAPGTDGRIRLAGPVTPEADPLVQNGLLG